MTFWFPDVPVWMWSLGFCVILLYFNSRSVNNFGTVEFWFALIKVTAIVLFIILGAASIFGLGLPAVGFHNLTGLPGGFLPNGLQRPVDGGDRGHLFLQRHRGDRGHLR